MTAINQKGMQLRRKLEHAVERDRPKELIAALEELFGAREAATLPEPAAARGGE